MSDKEKRIKKFINFRYHDYKSLEEKLNNYAKQGLFLESVTSQSWIFRKGEPKDLKYTVTYFSDTSIFDSKQTDGLKTYIDYAKEYGYNFITQAGKIQIFVTEVDNPIPLETDQREKFETIKQCSKVFTLNSYALLFIFGINVFTQMLNITGNPVNFFSNSLAQMSLIMMILAVTHSLHSIISYKSWCKKCANSLSSNGELALYNSKFSRFVDKFYFIFALIMLAVMLFYASLELSTIMILSICLPVVFIFIAFTTGFYIIKKRNFNRSTNRIIYISIGVVSFILYNLIIFFGLFHYSAEKEVDTERTITVTYSDGDTRTYNLYSDELPLTCEDLYGDIGYDDYSYKAAYSNTLFMKSSDYTQYSFEHNDVPEISYSIYEPKFNFVYNIVHDCLIEDNRFSTYTQIDNTLFNTNECYAKNYENQLAKAYVLFYDDMIIVIDLDAPLIEGQADLILDRLIQ